MHMYMIVTADEYELPLAVCDSANEVAQLLGRVRGDVYSAITRKHVSQDTFNGYRYKIIRIKMDEENENDHS